MAEVKAQKRKPAPTAQSIVSEKDERRAKINHYKEEGYAYKFHRFDVTDEELARNGYEKVVDNGEVVNHNGDPLIRREIGLDEEVRKMRQKSSYEMIKDRLASANKGGKLTQKANPKSPTSNDKYE